MSRLTQLALFAAAAATLTAGLLAPVPAAAREGNSVGHGIKCYWVLNANGVLQQVCRKSL